MTVTAILTDPIERTRFLKFAVVGAIGAVVDFGTFNLLTKFLSVQPVLASVFSFTAAVLSNFTWNRYWTYPDSRSKPLMKQLGEFGLVNLIGVGIRTPVFAFLKDPLTLVFERFSLPAMFASFSPSFFGNNLALAIAVLLVMLWNFFVNRYWTYNDVE